MIYTLNIHIPEIKSLFVIVKSSYFKTRLKLDNWLFNKGNIVVWKIMYRLTGRCGSLTNGHYPIYGNKQWLWTHKEKGKFKYATCNVCGAKEKVKRGGPSFKNYSDMGRRQDMSNLRRMEDTASNEAERTAVKHSIHKLKFEDKKVKSMRESLIKATRENDHAKIREIHDFVGTHKGYQNE